jgi:hypothetical protein
MIIEIPVLGNGQSRRDGIIRNCFVIQDYGNDQNQTNFSITFEA